MRVDAEKDGVARLSTGENDDRITPIGRIIRKCDAPIFKDAEAVMALPEVATAYTTDLKKLTFDKSKMPPIGKAVEALKNLHEILVRFEAYRTKKQNEEQP